MRMTCILILVAALQVSARGYTQTVTISLKNVSLEKVFAEIKKQTGYNFIYTDQMLQGTHNVNLEVKSATLETVLDICLKNQPLTYNIVNKTIVLQPKDISPNADATDITTSYSQLTTSFIDISGKVTDPDGNPLSGATVKVKGSSKITTTNNAGVFVLKGIDNDAVLEISFVGYQPYTIAVNNKSTITASLKLNVITNPEVIINKGYYTEREKVSISNVGKVTAADIEKQPVQNILLAAQARVPGLFVTQNSGNAGSSIKIRIQGENSILSGNDPIYIVDGVPIDPQLPSTGNDGILGGAGPGSSNRNQFAGWGNPLNYLNPLDIESVEILKDADATAIYGSRAANGAVLITTKKGKAGAMRLDVNIQTGWGKMTRRMDMMNTRQYLDMRYEAFKNDGIDWTSPSVSANDLKLWDTTRYTNWQNELLGGTAHYNDINASVSGGTALVRYLVSGTYHKENTILPLPKDFADQKASVHFNLNANNNNQKLRMQFTGNYMFDDNELPQSDFTMAALLLEPDAPPLLNADGSVNWAPDANGNSSLSTVSYATTANPLTQQYLKYTNKTHNLLGSLKLDYTVLPGLNIGSSFGYNYMQTNDFSPSPLIAVAPEARATAKRSASFGDRNIQSWIIEPQASYRTKIYRGTLDLLMGSTFQDKKATGKNLFAFGQLSDALLENISAAAGITQNGNTGSVYRYNSLFGRASYNWSDKYIASLNLRRDGSTRFGADSRFHNFYSAGAAWVFSSEKFFKPFAGLVNFAKLRGSYGTTGNDQIGDYRFMSLYNLGATPVPYQGTVGLYPAGLPNPNLQWEETRKLQIGLDLGLWQDKLVINTNFIRNRSSNQLLPYNLPSPTGFFNYTVNFPATVQNKNWEFMVTGKIVQNKNLNWTGSINFTLPQNKLIAFPGKDTSTYTNTLVIGQPIDVQKYFHWVGVAPGTGAYLYESSDGHLTLTPNADLDRTELISLFPKFYGGFTNTITWKNLQLDFIFQFVKQNGYNDPAFYNGSIVIFPGMFGAGNSNQPVTVLDRWQKPGDVKPVARYSTYGVSNGILNSDHRFADASYVSLKNVSLSYDLPKAWTDKAHFRSLRVYTHVQNVLMLTKFNGLNPETQSVWKLPPLQMWTVGVQAGL